MVRVEKILIFTGFVFVSLIMGLGVELLVFLFALIPIGRGLNPANISFLLNENGIFYLLHLIPFFAIIAGVLAAKYYCEKRSQVKEKYSYYKNTINRIIDFASRIGRGDLNQSFVSLNGDHQLGEALEKMRESLIDANRRESRRMSIAANVAEINELIRPMSDIEQLGDAVTAFMVNRIEQVVQGAFYAVNEEDGTDKRIEMLSVYAYDRKKHLKKEFKFNEGLIGQAAMEKDIIHRTEIPDHYVSVTSGLIGHKKPRSIIILPLINNEKVNGILELAAISRFSGYEIELITELGTVIARSINSVKTHQKTLELLHSSEKMSNELAEQKAELEANATKMVLAQEELRESNQKLEEHISEVRKINRKTQLLLENSLEVIFIFSSEGETLYVSPSVFSVLGYYPDEIIGRKNIDNIHPLDTERFSKFIRDIIQFPEKKHTIQYRYFTRSGNIIWMEAIGKNSLADVISGIVINSRDISEQRLAEKEQRMRAKMQALSENSLDMILRIDIFNRFTYVNPVVEKYTDMNIDDFINKPVMDVGLDENVVDFFKKMMDEVSGCREKKIDEMVFGTADGDKIMEVSAIPEYQDNGEIESVLFVCHDITEARGREDLIKKKNKSISDSINYAYYIQDALMPTAQTLREIIPNSFMIYKPKDIVSGDYPFLVKRGDLVYLGAMDCTGHGVPGALMSIIGYFLQNQIINMHPDDDAGAILDKLHHNVVESLRQDDENSMINDGMDAAFCKIDLKNGVLNYAGAHRPLYYVNKGNFKEIRGDRFPVGSTQYSNRKNFTNHSFNINHGDAFYLMSDGYGDQYGGPTGKQKFMSGRVSLMIKENTNLSIFQMEKLFLNSYEEWKGDVEQLDDILIMGLKF